MEDVEDRTPVESRGNRGLEYLADVRVGRIVEELVTEPRQPKVLKARLSGYPHGTVMQRLRALADEGMVQRTTVPGPPSRVRYGVTDAGRDYVRLAEAAKAWGSPTDADTDADPDLLDARLNALAAGWTLGVLVGLAGGPVGKTRLSTRVGGVTHHQVEHQLAALERTGLADHIGPPSGVGKKYRVSALGRAAMGVVVLAAFWEHRYPAAGTTPNCPDTLVDALPILMENLTLPDDMNGVCTLTLEGLRSRALHVTVVDGQVVSCVDSFAASPAWARGSVEEWEAALRDGRTAAIVYGDGRDVIEPLVRAIHEQVFLPLG